jgi:hypothetical protein
VRAGGGDWAVRVNVVDLCGARRVWVFRGVWRSVGSAAVRVCPARFVSGLSVSGSGVLLTPLGW